MTDIMDRVRKCKRCGKNKPPPRDTLVSHLCAECEAETLCKHAIRQAGGVCCAVGCDTTYRDGGRPCWWNSTRGEVSCAQFAPVGLEACLSADSERLNRKHVTHAILALTALIKLSHRDQDWSGVVECPVCHKQLSAAHSSCNGHTIGKCETEGCVAWIE